MRLLTGLLVLGLIVSSQFASAQNCQNTSVGYPPLTDMRNMTYQGFSGGLYPDERNVRPVPHELAGFAEAQQIVPLDLQGQPDFAQGKIVLLSIGMSNTEQNFDNFILDANNDPDKNPQVIPVNGAQGGWSAEDIKDPGAVFWGRIDTRLFQQGLSADQVQVIWFLEAHQQTTGSFPGQSQRLRDDFKQIMQIIRTRYPNARLCYCSSRTYGGYGNGIKPWVSEPWAYENGFAVKWLIEDQINGDPDLNYDPNLGPVRAPWIAWGPYLWADGLQARSDGFIWECADFRPDGIHPSPSGTQKTSDALQYFFKADPTASLWYDALGRSYPSLRHTQLQQGQPTDFVVSRALPGERAFFLYSLAGVGAGPCSNKIGGLCLDLLKPITLFGNAVVQPNGFAFFTWNVPSNFPLGDLHTQAVIRRGPGHANSVKTQTVTGTVIP